MSIFWCRGLLWGQKKASEDDVYASCHRATPDNVCLRISHAYWKDGGGGGGTKKLKDKKMASI
jgi:hypothetical protein